MNLTKLTIKGISYSQTQTGAYALVLSEENGPRTLPIIIGAFEAQSIAIALEKEIKPPRPLTHDLFKSVADSFEITIKEIVIHKLTDGVFFSRLTCIRKNVEEIIDTRTSDAIALAVRFNSPIYTYDTILDKAGFQLDAENDFDLEEDEYDTPSSEDNIEETSIEELENQLEDAVANENYELAAKIRDEISKRS